MSGPMLEETLRSLNGAWLLFRQKEEGYRLFTVTIGGFWRSFGVFFIIFPIFLFSLYVEGQMIREAPPEIVTARNAGADYFMMLALGVEWIAFPILMVFLTKFMNLSQHYVPYIIAYNWSAAIITFMLLPALILTLVGILSPATAMAINTGVTFFMLYYRWFIARTALHITGSTAAAIVAIDFLLSMMISVAAINLGRLPAPIA